MSLILILTCSLVTSYQAKGSSGALNDARNADNDASASNSSYYSTREIRDMMLKDWAGKTQEVQEYFDQIPSEEFKENSDTLKLMHYYEKKGLKDIDTRQIYNITPHVREPAGPEYTIEVNDSYVPKYRVSTSEEINMEKYGTFNSKPEEDSSEENVEDASEASVTTEPPDSEGEKKGGKKKRKSKNWPPNMDPKGKIRRKKKKRTLKDEVKRKEMIKQEINKPNKIILKVNKNKIGDKHLHGLQNNYHLGILGIRNKMNTIGFEEAYKKNMEGVINRKLEEGVNLKKVNRPAGRLKGKAELKSNLYRPNHVSIFDSFITRFKLKHKLKDHSHHHQHRNFSRSRHRFWSNNRYPQSF